MLKNIVPYIGHCSLIRTIGLLNLPLNILMLSFGKRAASTLCQSEANRKYPGSSYKMGIKDFLCSMNGQLGSECLFYSQRSYLPLARPKHSEKVQKTNEKVQKTNVNKCRKQMGPRLRVAHTVAVPLKCLVFDSLGIKYLTLQPH